MNLIVDLQYFPSIILYKSIDKFSNIVFEQYEHYQKMSFRNRCQIAGAEGVINLSVPLVNGRDQKTLLRDVKISDRHRWQDQHWKTIQSCYSRSPWFEFYRDGLGALYEKPFVFLKDWNLTCFEWSLEVLKIPLPFALTEAWQKSYDGKDWVDWRGQLLPKNTGKLGAPEGASSNRRPGDRKPHDEPRGGERGGAESSRMGDLTENAGITSLPEEVRGDQGTPKKLLFSGEDFGLEAPVKYSQVFEERTGFLSGLSVLDLLFCEGKRAKLLLTGI
jgi:WbqC-like protein family